MSDALGGVNVIRLVVDLPGPIPARRLHLLGTSVANVEPPTGNPARILAPAWRSKVEQNGPKVAGLDLKDPGPMSELDALLQVADGLVMATHLYGIGTWLRRPRQTIRSPLHRCGDRRTFSQWVSTWVRYQFSPKSRVAVQQEGTDYAILATWRQPRECFNFADGCHYAPEDRPWSLS